MPAMPDPVTRRSVPYRKPPAHPAHKLRSFRIDSGPEAAMFITPDEYRSRIERLAAFAADAGLDGVLLTAESNIDYFSGYRHHAP